MTDSEKRERTAELADLASKYVQYKAEVDRLDKKCKSYNTSVKQLMCLLNIDTLPVGDDGTELQYKVTKRESLNEDKLITKLKRYAPDTECIKTKEYIDMDILENEIYHGELSNDAMIALDECREVKEIPRLDIKKGKR